jgi:antitoxin YefM
MPIVSQSEFRANMAKLLDQVEADSKELIIFRQGKQPMVVIPMEQFESWNETNYLLSDPVNAEHLRESIAQAERGDLVEFTMEELNAFIEDIKENAA